MRWILITLLLLALTWAEASAEPKIVGDIKYKPHSLVRLKAEGVDAKSAILWRIYPNKDVQRATCPRGLLEFAAHPGVYEVELLVIANVDGALSVDEARTTITIESCTPVPPRPDPKPDPKTPGDGKLDPVNALGRIRFGNAGCTATVVGPRRNDGRWDVLTAAHCVTGVGQRGTMSLKDGRTFNIRVITHDKTSDLAWLVTDEETADMPYANLASRNPDPETEIWHMGYGVDRPGNKESGSIAERENGQGQIRMILSVSSGDSGGGIFRADSNELIAVVCCTSGMARKVSMWGGSVETARKSRPKAVDDRESWVPTPIPIRDIGQVTPVPVKPVEITPWNPQPIPICVINP